MKLKMKNEKRTEKMADAAIIKRKEEA